MPPNGGRALCTATASAAALLFLPAARAVCAAAGACALYAEVAGDPSRPWKWNLGPLCNGGKGYTFNNGSSQYRFEICGSIDPVVPALPTCTGDGTTPCQVQGSAQTNTYCNPEYSAFPNVASALVFFDPNPATTCYYGPTSGTPAPGNYGGCPNTGTVGRFNLPDLCCTGQCDTLAFSPMVITPIDPANFSAGVTWTTTGNSADSADEYQCPRDPNTGYPVSRSVRYVMPCDPAGKATDAVVVRSFGEESPCQYVARFGPHKLACGAATKCKLLADGGMGDGEEGEGGV